MTISINTVYSGMNTIRNLSMIKRNLQTTMQRMSSGLKINKASDNPAGLVISEQMRSQIGELTQTIKNLELNINKNNTADSAVGELRGNVQEMRSIALAAGNTGTDDNNVRAAYQAQLDDLVGAVNSQIDSAAFGTQNLLNGSEGSVANVAKMENLDISEIESVEQAVEKIDSTLKELNTVQATIGAKTTHEYSSTVRSLEVSSQNLVAAESIIRDADYAQEQTAYIQQMIQLNVGLAALAQGNLVPESVFKLMHA